MLFNFWFALRVGDDVAIRMLKSQKSRVWKLSTLARDHSFTWKHWTNINFIPQKVQMANNAPLTQNVAAKALVIKARNCKQRVHQAFGWPF